MSKITSYFDLLDHAESQITSAQASFFADPSGAAAEVSPYAAMELLDASFGVFNSDYLEAIAALNASLAELKAAKSALEAVKNMQPGKEKEAAETAAKEAATAAAGRVESVTDFAADVAARESTVIATAAKVAGADAKADAASITAALNATVAKAVGISAAQIEAVVGGGDNALKASAQALAAKKLAAQVSDAKAGASEANKSDVAKKAAASVAKQQAEVAKKIADYKAAAVANASNAKAKAMYEKLAENAQKTADDLKTNEKSIVEGLKGDYTVAEQNAKAAAEQANAKAAANAESATAIDETALKEAAGKVADAKKDAVNKAKEEQQAIDNAIKNMQSDKDFTNVPQSDAEKAAATAVENKPEYKASASAQLSSLSLQASKKYILVDNVESPSTFYGTFKTDATNKVTYVSNDGKIVINDVQSNACLNKFKAALTDTTGAEDIDAVLTGTTGTATVGDFAYEKTAEGSYVTYKGHKYEIDAASIGSKFKNLKDALDNAESTSATLVGNDVKLKAIDGMTLTSAISITVAEQAVTIANTATLKQLQDLAAKQSLANLKAAGASAFGQLTAVNTDAIKYNGKAIEFGEKFDFAKAAALQGSGGSKLDALIAAGATKYDGVDLTKVENGYLTYTAGSKTYKIDIAATASTAANLSALVAEGTTVSTNTIGAIEVVAAKDVATADLKTTDITFPADGKAQDLKVDGNLIGTLIHSGANNFFLSKDGLKVKVTAVSPKAEIFNDFVTKGTLKELKTLGAASQNIELNGKNVTWASDAYKAEGVVIKDTAKVADIAKYLKDDLVADFAKIVDASAGATLDNSGQKGTLTNTTGTLTWKSKSNDVAFTIADGAKIADLEAIDSHSATYANVAKVAKMDTLKVGQTDIKAANIPLAKADFEGVSLDKLAEYLTATSGGKISQLKAIVGSTDKQTNVVDAQGNKVGEINGNSGKADWTVANAITIKGLLGTASVADLLKVKAGASWNDIKAVLDASSEITVGSGGNKFTWASSALKLAVGESSIEVNTGTIDNLEKLTNLTTDLEHNSGLAFDYSKHTTLDLSNFKGEDVAIGGKGTVTAANQVFDIKQDASSTGTYVITTGSFTGAKGKMVTINLENFLKTDTLKITTTQNSTDGQAKNSAITVANGLHKTNSSTTDTGVQTTAGSTGPGDVKDSSGNELKLYYAKASASQADSEALAIAAAIDAEETAGGTAGASYLLKTIDASVVYLINVGSADQNDQLVVKLTGVPDSGIAWTIDTNALKLAAQA